MKNHTKKQAKEASNEWFIVMLFIFVFSATVVFAGSHEEVRVCHKISIT